MTTAPGPSRAAAVRTGRQFIDATSEIRDRGARQRRHRGARRGYHGRPLAMHPVNAMRTLCALLLLGMPLSAQISWVSHSGPASSTPLLVYDALRTRTVQLGSDATTWEYRGSGWSRIATAAAPSAR